jgi:hypothetical protein
VLRSRACDGSESLWRPKMACRQASMHSAVRVGVTRRAAAAVPAAVPSPRLLRALAKAPRIAHRGCTNVLRTKRRVALLSRRKLLREAGKRSSPAAALHVE